MNRTDQGWLAEVGDALRKETAFLRTKKRETQNLLRDHYLELM